MKNTSLVQALAVQSQINLPGTAGRLLKQIRDLESLAPRFIETGLIRPVARPTSLDVRLSGVSTRFATAKLAGGFLFASAAVRMDLRFERNALATEGTDSTSLIDDIDFLDQSKRLQLIEVRQAYELADNAMNSENPPKILIIEGPLVLNRSMVPLGKSERHLLEYERSLETISSFWKRHQDRLYPWNPEGTVVAGIATERLGAIAAISQHDLRTADGQQHLLLCDQPTSGSLAGLNKQIGSISGIGEKRFMRGILGNNSRTAALRMNVQTPRMEPFALVNDFGVIGFHYRGGVRTDPLLVQLFGNDSDWTGEKIDEITGILIAATVQQKNYAVPIPFQLAENQLQSLNHFLKQYCYTMKGELKNREIEDSWLSDLED